LGGLGSLSAVEKKAHAEAKTQLKGGKKGGDQ
jgi:hypothetical protein